MSILGKIGILTATCHENDFDDPFAARRSLQASFFSFLASAFSGLAAAFRACFSFFTCESGFLSFACGSLFFGGIAGKSHYFIAVDFWFCHIVRRFFSSLPPCQLTSRLRKILSVYFCILCRDVRDGQPHRVYE